MHRLTTQNQRKKSRNELQDLMETYFRSEESDQFAKEWNELVVEFSEMVDSETELLVGLKSLRDEFAFYETSPLNEYCKFKELFELIATAEAERMRHLERFIVTDQYFHRFDDEEESKTVNDIMSLIIEVSESPDEVRLLVLKLFARLKECRVHRILEESEVTFGEYIDESVSAERFDIAEVVRKRKGITAMLDEGHSAALH